MFRTVPLSIISSFFTVHTAMVYVIQFCWQLASRIRTELHFRPDPARRPVWHIPLLCVQWKTADDGQKNCPKHVVLFQKYAVQSWSCPQAVSKPVWHIPLLCVQWKSPSDGQKNCPKHVVLLQNKFGNLVHLVVIITRNFTLLNIIVVFLTERYFI